MGRHHARQAASEDVIDEPTDEKLWGWSYDGLDCLHIAAAAIVKAERLFNVAVGKPTQHVVELVLYLADRYRKELKDPHTNLGEGFVSDSDDDTVPPLCFADADKQKEYDDFLTGIVMKARSSERDFDKEKRQDLLPDLLEDESDEEIRTPIADETA